MEKKAVNPSLGKPDRKSAPKKVAVIDQKGCTGCHACVPLCPVDCIENVPGKEHPDFMRVVEVDLDRCIGCSICADYCPWETIFMIPGTEGEEKAKEWTIRSILYQNVGEETEASEAAAPVVEDKVG